MIYVTDTHTLFWHLTQSQKLGRNACATFSAAEANQVTIIIPTIVLAELLFIFEKNKAENEFQAVLAKLKNSTNFVIQELNFDIVTQISQLRKISEMHDRIITATALYLGAKVLTKDQEIKDSGYIETVW